MRRRLDRPAAFAQSRHGSGVACGLVCPNKFPEDIRETTRAFYRLFYDVDPRRSQGSTPCLAAPVWILARPFFILVDGRPVPS
jgi:hypothetical protein